MARTDMGNTDHSSLARPFLVGLTGGIGSGKTAASDYLASKGIKVVDADVVAREVVDIGEPALEQIKNQFGEEILLQNGALNRPKLREIIFSDPDQKNWLEQLLHPLIRERIVGQLSSANSPYAVLVSPLLFETNQHQLIEHTLLIDAPESSQLERVKSRDGSTDDTIKSIIDSQMPRARKQALADDIICNDGDLDQLYQQLDTVHESYLKGRLHFTKQKD